MRLREPNCLASIIAEPLGRTKIQSTKPKVNGTRRYGEKAFATQMPDPPSKRTEKRLCGGKHTVISIHDRLTRLSMQNDSGTNPTLGRLICVDTQNPFDELNSGTSGILGGIVRGVLATESHHN